MFYVQLPSGTVLETENPSLWPEAKRLWPKHAQQLLRDEARESLRKTLQPGDTIYTVLRHVSKSGMSRRIDLYKMINGDPIFLSGDVAHLLGDKLHKDGGVVVNGCGMDMGFHLVHNLSIALFCDPGKYTHDGAYALKHRWL